MGAQFGISLTRLPFSLNDVLLVLLYVVTVSAAIIIWCLFVILLWSIYQRKRQASFLIEMENRGNVDTPLQFNIELGDLAKKVKASWWTDNKRQSPKSIQQVSFEEEIVPAESAPPSAAAPSPSNDKKKEEKKKKTEETKKKAKEKAGVFKGILQAVASLSSGLAAILPGDLKKPFKALASSIQKTQSSATYVMSEPERLAASGKQMQANVRRLKNPTGPQYQKKPGQTTSAQAATGAKGATTPVAVQTTTKVRRRITKTIQLIETRLLNPAEKVVYKLILRPNNPFGRLSGLFSITSLPLEYDDFPSYNKIMPQSLTGNLEIKRISAGLIVLFVFTCLFILALTVGGAVAMAGWLRIFLPVL
jgi:hypothetical protein